MIFSSRTARSSPSAAPSAPPPPESSTTAVTVKQFDGKTKVVYGSPDMIFSTVKFILEMEWGVPSEQMRLIFSGSEVSNGSTLQSVGVSNGSVVYCILDGGGGAAKSQSQNGTAATTTTISLKQVPRDDPKVEDFSDLALKRLMERIAID
jgi:hypothetical protein